MQRSARPVSADRAKALDMRPCYFTCSCWQTHTHTHSAPVCVCVLVSVSAWPNLFTLFVSSALPAHNLIFNTLRAMG